jgi:hypothetical protein
MFTPRTRRVIFIFMQGGPSHVESFDYKPELIKRDGQEIDFTGVRFGTFGKVSKRRLMKPLWEFQNYGECGRPVSALFPHITNTRTSEAVQKQQFDFLQSLNRQQQQGAPEDDRLDATIESFELAYRMQQNAPGLMDLSQETEATLGLYGIGEKPTDDFGRQCLLARRLAEADVRYIQLNYSDESPTPRWDQHSNMPKHADHARATDKPVAGLLADFYQRGLLGDTLVWWGGEFGRTPFAQGKDGRDHNPRGFTVWLAGGGVKSGIAYGETDEIGHEAVTNKIHMHDLHATILHLLGLDHERLTYRYAGRDFRLTDVAGNVVHDIIA